MKFIAKLKPRSGANVALLIKEFFASSLDKESCISIKDGEVSLTVGFEKKPSKGIIDAIEKYEVIEFFFKVDNINGKENESISCLNRKDEQKIEKVTITATDKPQKNVGVKFTGKSKSIEKLDEIPEVKEMIQSSKSFEEFLNKISEWLNLKNGKNFEILVKAAVPTGKSKRISWNIIFANMANAGIVYAPQTIRIKYTVAVSEKMKMEGYTINPIKFIRLLGEYANYWNKNEKESNKVKADSDNSTVGTEISLKDENTIKILFASLMDVAQKGKISVRTENVFKRLGLKERDRDLLEIADIALKFPAEQLTWNELFKCLKSIFPTDEDQMDAQMRLSKLINEYAHKLGLGKVKAIDFLMEMKKVILSNLD